MFTGIVAAVGKIVRVDPLGQDSDSGVRLTVAFADLPMEGVRIGDSIALQGACMTVVSYDNEHFTVDVSQESLRHTVGLAQPGEVNLEKALCLGDALGGHLLTGHVDGIAKVLAFERVGESHRLDIRVPKEFSACLAYKGSVGINGVSLTVNSVTDGAEGTDISLNLIPHTVAVTTLQRLVPGDPVNFEVDLIARYVQRMLAVR